MATDKNAKDKITNLTDAGEKEKALEAALNQIQKQLLKTCWYPSLIQVNRPLRSVICS